VKGEKGQPKGRADKQTNKKRQAGRHPNVKQRPEGKGRDVVRETGRKKWCKRRGDWT